MQHLQKNKGEAVSGTRHSASSHNLVSAALPRVTEHRSQGTGHGLCFSLPRYLVTSLPAYFLTSRRASHASCYTVPPMARQRLGQHFLTDLHWREELARAIRVSPHSTVPPPR